MGSMFFQTGVRTESQFFQQPKTSVIDSSQFGVIEEHLASESSFDWNALVETCKQSKAKVRSRSL